MPSVSETRATALRTTLAAVQAELEALRGSGVSLQGLQTALIELATAVTVDVEDLPVAGDGNPAGLPASGQAAENTSENDSTVVNPGLSESNIFSAPVTKAGK